MKNMIKLTAFFGMLGLCTWATLELGGMVSSLLNSL